jgi:peptidoglycan/xylan/chitin deacetylase (PgdA/CDA1 family)
MPTSRHGRLASLLDRTGALRVLEWFARRPGLLVLNYHRIGSINGNQLDDGVISATADEFRSQVRYLHAHFALPGLDDLVGMGDARFAIRSSMALITFDDGYRDNFELAFPILREIGVPATFFIATSFIQKPRLPWWDHIAYIVKNTRREAFTLDYPAPFAIDLRRSTRSHALQQVLNVYKQAAAVREDDFLRRLGDIAEVEADSESLGRDLFMSWDQIRRLNNEGMSIGSHTHSHRILSALNESEQRNELSLSKEILEAEVRRPIDAVAYPVGQPFTFNGLTKRLAKEVGYRIGFSYYGGFNRTGHMDLLDLRRTTVEFEHTFPQFRTRATLQTLLGRSV